LGRLARGGGVKVWSVSARRVWLPRMATRRIGDTIIEKRVDGRYDILRIGGTRWVHLHDDVVTFEDARRIAHETRAEDGQVWYREYGDPPGHLEPS
jgi:hypothetical protein